MSKNVWTAGVALIVGCAAGLVGKEAIVPTAGAQLHGKQFLNRCIDVKWEDISDKSHLRPDLGAKGWELVTLTSAMQRGTTRLIACFKREVP
jgi:hypothetical protein